jgi:serine protease inhibitor
MTTTINPKMYQALVVRRALLFYIKTGMRVNRAYTPRNMIRTAEAITGLKFKPRAYQEAADALQKWVDDKTPPWE